MKEEIVRTLFSKSLHVKHKQNYEKNSKIGYWSVVRIFVFVYETAMKSNVQTWVGKRCIFVFLNSNKLESPSCTWQEEESIQFVWNEGRGNAGTFLLSFCCAGNQGAFVVPGQWGKVPSHCLPNSHFPWRWMILCFPGQACLENLSQRVSPGSWTLPLFAVQHGGCVRHHCFSFALDIYPQLLLMACHLM